MKIVVFGATGRTGLPLVQQALNAGHEVVAFVRDPAKMSIRHQRLTLVQGDVMNAADVNKAITPAAGTSNTGTSNTGVSNTDAVVSVLAPAKNSPKELLPVAVDNIVGAMKRHGARRLIYMTGAGVDMPEDKPKLVNHIIKFALKTMAGEVLAQSERAVCAVQNSGLEWTIVRVPVLNDNPHSGQYRVGWVGDNTGHRMSRADAADFILKQLTDTSYLRKAPLISN